MNRALSLLIVAAVFGSQATKAQAELLYGLTNFLELVSFDSATPGTVTMTPLPGFSIFGNSLSSIDVRPSSGQLFAAGPVGFTTSNNLYTINPITGASAQIGTFDGGGTGRMLSIDFNPVVDRIRVLESNNTPNNFRVNPNDGSLVATDTNVSFLATDVNAGQTPDLVAAAYTNSVAPTPATTTLFAIDAGTNSLVSFANPNGGTLQTIGALGIPIGDGIGFNAFDISGQSGIAYLVASGTADPANTLYSVNLSTGSATSLGVIGLNAGTLRGLAVAGSSAVPEPSSLILSTVFAAAGGLTYRRRRTKSL